MKRLLAVLSATIFGLFVAAFSNVANAAEATEADYLNELPTVLSVTRLAQALRDTPGSMTIIDADTIRRSGAREIADVLKLVPGFLVSSRRGGDVTPVYHDVLDEYGARMQVYVDGRSLYSSFLYGDTHRGLGSIQLEDVDRVEVLRGSNAASFGSNAFLGVVNVVTKAPADTHGVTLSYRGGEAGINDNYARVGWGGENSNWRLSTSRRSTTGFDNLYDDSRHSQVSLRGDLQFGVEDTLSINAGLASQAYGDGEPSKTCDTRLLSLSGFCDTNPFRTSQWRNGYARLVWDRQLSSTATLRVSAGYDKELIEAGFTAIQSPFATLVVAPGVPGRTTLSLAFPANGEASRQNIEVSRTDSWGEEFRTVFGAGIVREAVKSRFFFSSNDDIASTQKKLFTTAEWRPTSFLTGNFSGLWEQHDYFGTEFSPRIGFNAHISSNHTVRIGASKSSRFPSIYMYKGRSSLEIKLTPAVFDGAAFFSSIPFPYVNSSGRIRPETLYTNEVGYLGEFRDQRLTFDLRGFTEKLKGEMDEDRPDFINKRPLEIRGFEYQLTWKPFASTRILLSEANLRIIPENSQTRDDRKAPRRSGSLSIFQDLGGGVNLGLISHYATAYASQEFVAGQFTEERRLDARLGYNFRIGSTRAEAALVTQAAAGSSAIDTSGVRFTRRTFGTLKLDF